ncbi:MAG: Asp-tRNA(Asn)/Glu-tRNA(Gln) amidotransferase subunit GatC [Oligoflexia bacterium]|nr:Asp-tRNA(Asn)/Glu-tRNA(Gln) amidotransferase subunit GatC [Oligoflexia bacterium]
MSPSKIAVDEALTRKVATLARLELSDSEVSTFTAQLEKILGYVESIQELEVQGVEPLLSPLAAKTAFREDEILPALAGREGQPKVLEAAGEIIDGGYKVPPVL